MLTLKSLPRYHTNRGSLPHGFSFNKYLLGGYSCQALCQELGTQWRAKHTQLPSLGAARIVVETGSLGKGEIRTYLHLHGFLPPGVKWMWRPDSLLTHTGSLPRMDSDVHEGLCCNGSPNHRHWNQWFLPWVDALQRSSVFLRNPLPHLHICKIALLWGLMELKVSALSKALTTFSTYKWVFSCINS